MKNCFNWIIRTLGNMKIKRKFLLLVAVLIIPFFLMSYFIYNNITDKLIKSQLVLANQGYSQVKSFLDYRFEQIFQVSGIIAMDSTLNEILTKDPTSYPLHEQLKDQSIIKTYLGQFVGKNNNLDNLRLYVPGEFIYSSEEKLLYSLDNAKETLWYKNTFQDWGWVTNNPPIYVENNDAISIVRPIRDLQHYKHFIGAVRIDIAVSEIQQILSRINITQGCLSYIILSNGELIGSSSYDLMRSLQLDDQDLGKALSSEGQFVKLNMNREPIWIYASYLDNTDFILISVLPEKELVNDVRLIQFNYILSLVFLLLLIIIFILPSITSFTRRIKQIVDNMKLVQEGNLNVKLDTHYHDEIGTLVHDFNFMIERINELMQNQYMLGQELKTAELKALQSQINPHFLYNTLEMLGWMAYKHEPKEIQSMTNSLAQYYRLSLNHGDDITSISNELKLVESYLHIQSTRFRNDLSILIDIKDIGDFAIPKITLQPIVENSILHGILEKDNKSGTIKIKGRLKKDNMIELSIEDDGIGMDKAQISKLMNTKEPSNMGNYGLRNIEMRICLYFNIEKAIRIISKPGVGTKVLINFPPKPYNLQAN